jgi:TonB family protein
MVGVTIRAVVWLGLLLLFLQAPAAAEAQDVSAPFAPSVGDPEPPKPAVVVPPKLSQFAEPTYPPEALAQGLTGRVEVELVIGTDGHTHDLKVKTPAGHGFDEAALEAAARLIFEPATRNGTPLAARIVFPFVFELKPQEPEPSADAEPPPPAPGRMAGHVLESRSPVPVAEVELVLTNADLSITQRVVTDAAGSFTFGELPEGTYRVHLSKPDWELQELEETVKSGEALDLVYRIEPMQDKEAFRAKARIAPPPREVTRRTITKEELTRIPGTRGDALRTVELLPGVARPPFGAGVIIVRGSSPQDTQVLLDGIPVGLLYHFGGLTSFINSRLLESVDFYPGNFSVRYGRRRGGIIEASLSEPARDQLHGVADLNLIDGSLLAQGPISANWDFAVAARRSWLDVTLGAALSSADVSTVAAPVYYDYQALTTYRPTERDKIRLLVYGSSDRFKLLFEQPNDGDAAVTGNFTLESQFHRAHLSWAHKVSDRVDHSLELAFGSFNSRIGVGDAFNFSLKGYESYLRSEWRMRVTDRVRLIAGFDGAIFPAEVKYGGPPLGQDEGNANANGGTPLSNRSRVDATDKVTLVQPGAYLESDIDLAPAHIVLGARLDYDSATKAYSFDPRIAVHVAVTDTTRLKAGFGLFSQPPQYQESSIAFGNPRLRATHTVHASAGVDQTIIPGVKVGVEGFYKYLFNRVVGTEFGEPPKFINGGKGRIYGMEVSAKVDPRGRFFGYLSYTLSRSERADRVNDPYRLFDYDQPHILTISSVYRLGRGWEAGVTFRLTAGNPYTPTIGGIYNKDTWLYSPIYGAVNSARNPYFHKLDVRIEKLWTFQRWKLAAYVDVLNVYNNTNQEGIAYDYEYRRQAKVAGLPILPNLGIRGEL